MAKPSTVPTWDTNQTNIVTPPSGNQTDGFATGDQVPSGRLNYMLYWLYKWAKWLHDLTDGTAADAISWGGLHTFLAGVDSTGSAGVAGLRGTGGTNAAGVTGAGNGTGKGGWFIGGTTGEGVRGEAGGTAAGVTGLGGTSAGGGVGGNFLGGGTNGAGLQGTGSGTGGGGLFTGGVSGGPGIVVTPTGTGRGGIEFGGSVPGVTTGFTDGLTRISFDKAWGSVGLASGAVAPDTTAGRGLNFASAVNTGGLGVTVTVSFTTAMSTGYVVTFAPMAPIAGSYVPVPYVSSQSTGSFVVSFAKSSDGNPVNHSALGSTGFAFRVVGAQ